MEASSPCWFSRQMTTTFTGRTRAETKRKALAYWVDNHDSLGLTMREFFDRCALSADGTAIVFQSPERQKSFGLRLFARG